MNNLKIKNIKISVFVLIVSLLATTCSLLAPINTVSIPLLLLITAYLLIYLIINFIIYPKANTLQLIQISLYMLLSFLIISAVSIAFIGYTGLTKLNLINNTNISANLLYISTSLIFGLITIYSLIKVEKNIINTGIKFSVNTKINDKNEPEIKQQDLCEEISVSELHVEIEKKEENTVQNQTVTEQPKKIIMDEPDIVKIVANNEKHISLNEAKQMLKNSTDNNINIESSPLDLFDEPAVNLDENAQPQSLTDDGDELAYSADIFDSDDIPDDIRLIQSQRKKNLETTGVISSIGKLLINNRDIEHIIETNELMQQIGCNSEEVDIVSMAMGIKIYDKFNKIMVDYTQVKDLTLSNKAGFTIASIIKDSRRSETIGAIASSGFVVLNNYLQRLELIGLKKVFFESEEIIYSIFKVDDFILFFASDKTFNPVNYSTLKEVLDQNNINDQDMSIIKNIKGIQESAITNKDGLLIGSVNSQNPKRLASISSAIFENLKIFISSVDPVTLKKITVFTDDRILTIKKYDDKIASLLSESTGPIKLSNTIIEIENLMK